MGWALKKAFASRGLVSPAGRKANGSSIRGAGRVKRSLSEAVRTAGIEDTASPACSACVARLPLRRWARNSGECGAGACTNLHLPSSASCRTPQSSVASPNVSWITVAGISNHSGSSSSSGWERVQVAGRDYTHESMCLACQDGGDLLLCDLCPRAWHLECLEGTRCTDPDRPGKWQCPHHRCAG